LTRVGAHTAPSRKWARPLKTDMEYLKRLVLIAAICTTASGVAGGASALEAPKPQDASATQAAETTSPMRVQLSEKEMKKLFVKPVKPKYPPLAQQARIVGKCRVRIVVGADGNVRSIQLVYGHPLLAPAAVMAAKQSKYLPYLLNGQPVEAEGEVEYDIPY